MTTAVRKLARATLRAADGLGLVEREDLSAVARSRRGLRHLAVRDYLAERRIDQTVRVLDVGCGPGELARILIDHGYSSVSGCDWLPSAEVALSDPRFSYLQVDLNRTGLKDYPDASFDVVICSDVIEHLENASFMLNEIRRVLHPEGTAVITLPNAFNLIERLCWLLTGNSTRYKAEKRADEFGHITVIPSEVMRSLCARAGLTIAEVRGGYGFFDGFISSRKNLGTLLSYNIMWVLKRAHRDLQQ